MLPRNRSTRQLLRAFGSVPVAIPRDLAARAQLRVRLRAQESAQAAATSALLWVMTAASWVFGILSAPLVWSVFAWVGAELNLPKPVLEFGICVLVDGAGADSRGAVISPARFRPGLAKCADAKST